MQHIQAKNKDQYGKHYWLRMINSLSGFKSANLIGTLSGDGKTNLSIVSSVVHLGAKPPLMAFILRPHLKDSPRHTLMNILETKCFTLNHITKDFYKNAHQTSARYDRELSEFDQCGLEEEYRNAFKAPFVKGSPLQVALEFKERIDIQQNNTTMIIGEIVEFYVEEKSLMPDGYIDIESLGTLCVSGLDRYHQSSALSRLNYAKPDVEVYEIPLSGETLV